MLHERMKRNGSPEVQKRYRQAVLDTAEIYMSINPEVQWSVWGVNVANAMQLMLAAHELTGNAAYLHRADHFARLAVDLFLDVASPLPKLTSHDDFYEIESVTNPSGDVWMLVALEVQERLAKLDAGDRYPVAVETKREPGAEFDSLFPEGASGVWDCTRLGAAAASVSLSYGEGGDRSLFLSRREGMFVSDGGLPVDSLELIASDVISKIPTLEEAEPFNGVYRRAFSGKHREPSTARYGGFKDVLDLAGLLLVNHGTKAATITVTTTYHDSWDDRETKEDVATINPGEQVVIAVAAPERRFIRRLDFKCDTPGAVKLEQFGFAMRPRSKLNPLTAELKSNFGSVEPKLIRDGLVLDLTGEALAEIAADAEAEHRPEFVEEEGRPPVLRFDGADDFLSIADSDDLDLQEWTVIVLVRATGGPGVVIGKIDGESQMMNYRVQIDRDGKVSALVRGTSAGQQVNRQAKANVQDRFSVIAARFDPKADGVDKVTISIDGRPATYSYQNAEGELAVLTHDQPLLIGRQPGAEPRFFKGDIGGILLYKRALTDDELNRTARWLSDQRPDARSAVARPGVSKEAIVFLIAGQSNAGGVAAFSPESNEKSGMAKEHPTIPGSTAKEVGIPTTMDAYPRSFIWGRGFERLMPGKNLKGGYNDRNRHGIELPMAMLLEKQYPDADKFFIKHGPGGHNLHTQWKADSGPDYKNFKSQLDGAMADLNKRYQNVRVIGLYWDQGEGDVSKASDYQQNLTTLFAALRRDIGIPELQIYVRKMMFNEKYIPIAAAQTAVTAADAHAHLLDLDLGSNDKNFKAWAWTDNNGHLSSKAYLELAKRIQETVSFPSMRTPSDPGPSAAREPKVEKAND